MLYLDPHFVQPSVPSSHIFEDQFLKNYAPTYRCSTIRKLSLQKMCPSIAFGFYLRARDDFEQFKCFMLSMSKLEDSIFSCYEKKPEMSVEQSTALQGGDLDDDFVVL